MSSIWLLGHRGTIGEAIIDSLDHHKIITTDQNVHHPMEMNETVDHLIYNVGINHLDWVKRIDPDEMLETYDCNVVGLVRAIQAAVQKSYLQRIVVIGSDAAHRPMRTSIAYNASKAALEAAVKVIAKETAMNSRINIVEPGLISPSDMTEYVFQRTQDLRPSLNLESYMLEGIPAGRSGYPSEVAECVRWLIDDAPAYMTGSVLTVNGGR